MVKTDALAQSHSGFALCYHRSPATTGVVLWRAGELLHGSTQASEQSGFAETLLRLLLRGPNPL